MTVPAVQPPSWPGLRLLASGLADGDMAAPGAAEGWLSARGLGGLPLHRARQVHGAGIACGDGEAATHPDCDGLVTGRPGRLLMARGADCGLLCLHDARRRTLGVAHCGWRSVLLGLPGALARELATRYGSAPADLRAWIGPSIRACCFEVREDFVAALRERRPAHASCLSGRDGRRYFDLQGAIAAQLAGEGVAAGRIADSGRCTCCDPRFFSWRRLGERRVNAVFAALEDAP